MSSFRRDNLTFKFNTKVSKLLHLTFLRGIQIQNLWWWRQRTKEVSSADSRLKHAMIYTPFPISDLTSESGASDDTEVGNLYNPLVNLSDNDQQQFRKTYNMAGSVSWEIFKNFKAKAEVGYDDYSNKNNRFYGMTTYYIKMYHPLPIRIIRQ